MKVFLWVEFEFGKNKMGPNAFEFMSAHAVEFES